MKGIIHELRRRRVFTTAGLYVVGAWLILQVADVLFPGWGLPDAAVNVLFMAAVAGFPLALVFGWFFNITAHGIRRTMPLGPENTGEPRRLEGRDHLVLGMLLLVAGGIISYATTEILALPRIDESGIDGRVDLPLPEKLQNSVAVLPFENIGTDPEDQVFADGVSEEIRTRLGRHAELQVIARASSLQFRNSAYGVPRICGLLGVQYLLLGSVRRQGERIRVSAQLVADKGTQVWSENYDRILEDVFGIQDDISDLVATEVAPQIATGPGESYRPSLDAYRHFLAGRSLLYRRHQWPAQEELALAVELDPRYAEAQAEYAISLVIGFPEERALQQADAAIAAALDAAPDLPRAHAARGLLLSSQRTPDPVAAEAALREALRGDPNMADAMNWLAAIVRSQGRDKEADEWLEKAHRIDPFNSVVVANLAIHQWESGDPDRAEAMLRPMIELPEPPFMAFTMLWELYTFTGRLVEANAMGKGLLLAGGWQSLFLANTYAMLGELEIAAEWMSASAREKPDVMWVRTGWIQAQTPYWRGDYEQAAEKMRQAMLSNDLSLQQLAPQLRLFYGINVSLSGDLPGAVTTLAEALPDSVDPSILDAPYGADAYQALAWAYLRSGLTEQNKRPLEIVEQWFAEQSASIVMMSSEDLYAAARNAALTGDMELALERLELAIDAGWRDYYTQRHDPRWASMTDDPRYQALMEKVKADVDRQRAEVEKIDAEEDFPARLEQARAAREKSGR